MTAKKTTRSAKPASPLSEEPTTLARPRRRKSADAQSSAQPPKRLVTANLQPSETTPSAAAVTDEDIRIRAYFLSLEHSGNGMHEVDFWLLAERELKSSSSSTE